MAKRDEPKKSDSKRKTKAQRHSAATEANKHRRINRKSAERDRPDSQVSENCLKKRRERARNDTPMKRRNAREAGEIQFGEKAKGWHLHQRENGLATALTPKEFHKMEERRRVSQKQQVVLIADESS